MVAYPDAAAHPKDVVKLVVSEAPIPDPSIYMFASLTATGPGLWWFGSLHASSSTWVDASWMAALACSFHRPASTPATRSHRQSDPSPMMVGSSIQGTRWAANPGASMVVKPSAR